MATLSAQALQSFTVAVGPGPTNELEVIAGAAAGASDFATALTDSSVAGYTQNIYCNSINGTVVLQDGTLTNNDTSSTISWESANQILVTGVAASPTLTGPSGANGLVIGASGRRLGFFGATSVVKQTVTGSKGANAALTSLLTALANLGFITDSSS